MTFQELETIMISKGVKSLADIARYLNSSPQAVSNWKARGRVPYKIAVLVKYNDNNVQDQESKEKLKLNNKPIHPTLVDKETISIVDILLIVVKNLKIIIIIPIIMILFTFIKIQFFDPAYYVSWATILIPENKSGNMSGIQGIASQFGVNIPQSTSGNDLSNPSLLPDFLRSRTFAEKIINKEFYVSKYGKKLSLLAILTGENKSSNQPKEEILVEAIDALRGMIVFEENPTSNFSILTVSATEPILAKELADQIILELESMNRSYKNQSVKEKISFINERINSVNTALDNSEQNLKNFNERNRQISSPALSLEQERLLREVDVQKAVYLTLKQQLELAKIEGVQSASVIQILDQPQISTKPVGKKLFSSITVSAFLGAAIGLFFAFLGSYFENINVSDRKKFRRIKSLISKVINSFHQDPTILGVFSTTLIVGFVFLINHKSVYPTFFGLYSTKVLIINIIYSLIMFYFMLLFIRSVFKKIRR